MAEDKVLSYGDSLLLQDDVLLLAGPHWLNDKLIGFYFEYLATEVVPRRGVVLVPGAETFLLANLGPAGGAVVLEPLGFAACRLALLAVNDNPDASAAEGGSHWSLLAYSPADNTFLHYDSCRGANAGAARQVYEAARASCPPGARLAEQRSPQQANGWDCGVYVLALARLLCQRQQQQGPGGTASLEVAPQEVTPADVVQLRREVLDLIHSKAAAAAGG